MTEIALSSSTVSSTQTVLKNTYALLSLTLIFSSLMAMVGMQFPVGGWGSIGILVVALCLLFATSAYRNSPVGVLLVFGFTGLMGFGLGPLLNHHLGTASGSQAVALALAGTGAAFIALSTFVHVTKKDFNFLGGFLFVGLLCLIVVSLANLFFAVQGLSLILAYASAVIFSGYILYDTSNITSGRQTNYIMATIGLYLNILNLFQALLSIISGSDD